MARLSGRNGVTYVAASHRGMGHRGAHGESACSINIMPSAYIYTRATALPRARKIQRATNALFRAAPDNNIPPTKRAGVQRRTTIFADPSLNELISRLPPYTEKTRKRKQKKPVRLKPLRQSHDRRSRIEQFSLEKFLLSGDSSTQ